MNRPETHKPSLGDEIPYRRERIAMRTGSLVFDRHLDEKLAKTAAPGRAASATR